MSQAGLLHPLREQERAARGGADPARRDRPRAHDRGERWPQGADLLRAMVELVRHNAGTPGLVSLFSVLSAEATSADHPAHLYFRNRYEFVLGVIRQGLEEAGKAGILREGVDPEGAARLFVAVMDGLQVLWLLDPGFDMAGEVERFAQSLVTERL